MNSTIKLICLLGIVLITSPSVLYATRFVYCPASFTCNNGNCGGFFSPLQLHPGIPIPTGRITYHLMTADIPLLDANTKVSCTYSNDDRSKITALSANIRITTPNIKKMTQAGWRVRNSGLDWPHARERALVDYQ